MDSPKSRIWLIVRNDLGKVLLNVGEFPIQCPVCDQFLPELHQHQGSRYGHVGFVHCHCPRATKISLGDSDNIVEYIQCHAQSQKVTLDFRELYSMQAEDFERLKYQLGYDIFTQQPGKNINLSDLIRDIERRTGIIARPVKSDIPLPEEVKKWKGILQRKRPK